MIYARGTGDGIAWNGGERGTGGRQKGDWRETEGGLEGNRRGTGGKQKGDWRGTGGGTGGTRKREENLNH